MMRRQTVMAILGLAAVMLVGITAIWFGRGGSDKAEKAAAKRAKEANLLALAYPKSTGVTHKNMDVRYDPATDRTVTSIEWTGLHADGRGAGEVASATLRLSSSHKGRQRAPNDTEGSLDGSLTVRTTGPNRGVLAFAGAPGQVVIDGQRHDLRGASGGAGYHSAADEEVVRFRLPTELAISAASAQKVAWAVGLVGVELSASQIDELRELVARLNPRP